MSDQILEAIWQQNCDHGVVLYIAVQFASGFRALYSGTKGSNGRPGIITPSKVVDLTEPLVRPPGEIPAPIGGPMDDLHPGTQEQSPNRISRGGAARLQSSHVLTCAQTQEPRGSDHGTLP